MINDKIMIKLVSINLITKNVHGFILFLVDSTQVIRQLIQVTVKMKI